MRWPHWNSSKRRMLWLMLTASLSGCTHQTGNQYFCPPTITYDQSGAVRPEVYAVDRTCYKSMTEKLSACYAEAQ